MILDRVLHVCLTCKKLREWLYHIAFPPAVHENSCCILTSLSAFAIFRIFIVDILIGNLIVTHCGFSLQFSSLVAQHYRTSLPMQET